MIELIKELFGEEVTEEKVLKLQEMLEQNYVSRADFEKLQSEFTDMKTQHATELAEKEEQADQEKFMILLQHALEKAGAKNQKAVLALLSMEGLRYENGQIKGLLEQLEELKRENGYLFEEKAGFVQFVRPGSSSRSEITEEDFRNMSYMEKLKLKKEQPALYQEFIKKTGGKSCRLI
ncbi:MAG: hypothetical protein E7418_00175 [Ruminococcaceae bacterium]|nr:hypothetical protein [Oscillospiraceae bacterium]